MWKYPPTSSVENLTKLELRKGLFTKIGIIFLTLYSKLLVWILDKGEIFKQLSLLTMNDTSCSHTFPTTLCAWCKMAFHDIQAQSFLKATLRWTCPGLNCWINIWSVNLTIAKLRQSSNSSWPELSLIPSVSHPPTTHPTGKVFNILADCCSSAKLAATADWVSKPRWKEQKQILTNVNKS